MKVDGVLISNSDTPKPLVRTVPVTDLVWNRKEDTAFLKVKGYPIYVEDREGEKTPIFTKLYKDGVLMDYIDHWEYGRNTTGTDQSLVDNILIHDASGLEYTLVYNETVRNLSPTLALTHGLDRRNRMIPSRLNAKIIWSFSKNSDFDYNVVYANPDGSNQKTINKTFSNIVYLKEFEYNSDISPWRIEIFAMNAKRNGRTISPSSNTDLIPKISTTINSVTFKPLKKFQMAVRLRNTDNNIITNWSDRLISIRRYCLWRMVSGSPDTRIGNYFSIRLI